MSSKPHTEPASNTSPTNSHQDTLAQLKQALMNEGGIIKNTKDAKKHLDTNGLTSPDLNITHENIAKILLTLVATTATRRTSSDRIPEKASNIIKATALLLDELTTKNDEPSLPNLTKQLETSATFLKQAASAQTEATNKANVLLGKLEKLQVHLEKTPNDTGFTPTAPTTTSPTPYKNALVNGKSNPATHTHTPTQHRMLNRLGIKACQLLVNYETGAHDKLVRPEAPNVKPSLLIKDAINLWLNSPEDRNGPLPKKAFARTVQIFGNSRMLIEMNSPEAADWMRTNPDRILGDVMKCKTSILKRSHTVIARFMPTSFVISPTSLKILEEEQSLPPGSIQNATWIKDPTKRAPDQKFANIKLFCSSPESANNLITGPAYVMGSRLSIQKDIRTPGVCNKCQRYGHIARNCEETKDTCGLCGEEHRTSLCSSTNERKCTPCGSNEHTTNHIDCPTYQQMEQAMIDKDPEAASPYFLTEESWTWGHQSSSADILPPPPGSHMHKNRSSHKKPNNPSQKDHPQHLHQQTLPKEFTKSRAPQPQHQPQPQPQPQLTPPSTTTLNNTCEETVTPFPTQ